MELLNSTISLNGRTPTNISFLSPSFSSTPLRNKKYPSRITIPNSKKPFLHPQFLPLSTCSKRFQVSAQFRRPTNRRNYLRRKLTERQQQVNGLENPIRKSSENDIPELKFDSYSRENGNLNKRNNLVNNNGESESVAESETETRKKLLGESALWNKLESWVDQYKKDAEFWGIGTGPIFTVLQDSEGQIKRVVVNEEEILRRSQVNPLLYNDSETENLAEVNFKVSFAKDLAHEMEMGSKVIPNHSSVVKLVTSGGNSGLLHAVQGVIVKPGVFSRMSRVGVMVFCGLFVVWAVKVLFSFGEGGEDFTRLEKEMLRRKIIAKRRKEKMMKGSVEILPDPVEPSSLSVERPPLDKEVLVNSIIKANGLDNESALMEHSGYKPDHCNEKFEEVKAMEHFGYEPDHFNDKIQEIRQMARHARGLEQKRSSQDNNDGDDGSLSSQSNLHNGHAIDNGYSAGSSLPTSFDDLKDDNGIPNEEASVEEIEMKVPNLSNADVLEDKVSSGVLGLTSSNLEEVNLQSNGSSVRKKLRVIKSVKEAREYLSGKNHKTEVNEEQKLRTEEQTDNVLIMPSTNEFSNDNVKLSESSLLSERPNPSNLYENSSSEAKEHDAANNWDLGAAEGEAFGVKNLSNTKMSSGHEMSISVQIRGHEDSSLSEEASILDEKHNSEAIRKNATEIDLQMTGTTIADGVDGRSAKLASSGNKESWIERNFHEFEPIIQKIGVGFRENYLVARENANQELELESVGDGNELQWMKDERLRDIVFRVRENELSGRDPFHLINEEDKCAFFGGLEKKVEQENEKLMSLHKYFHSNIENLDYGADGISLYDPPEKIIPRWKVPPSEMNPEFLKNIRETKKEFVAERVKNSSLTRKDEKNFLQKSVEPSSCENTPRTSNVTDGSTELLKEPPASPKIIIEGSDGSVRAGKRSGREYWQHTKKWSQGFMEVYNSETDPEIKSVMKDMGKDLDRWITEKEIQEADDLMSKLPEKGRKFVEEKLNKVRREMELFGPQAVVSKYREYADQKEEDYLWWLDLPYILCIELYTVENGEQRVGLYSLEMAADLELDPKQYHVIAFEDAGDCKNLCYIIQARMEILRNGNAFVVARPPKDAFREAKANGFSVTVIRKGKLQLNVDQALEEVEEVIVEIGSKIYHDKIMGEHSVDINGLMKGVFGFSGTPSKRKRSKRTLKRRTKR